MMDTAASRHTARGVDVGADSEMGVRWRRVLMNEHHTRFRRNDISKKSKYCRLALFPIRT
jgi:hypothetical protein